MLKETRFARLTQNSANKICIINTETLRFVEENETTHQIRLLEPQRFDAGKDRLAQFEVHLPGLLFQMRQGLQGTLDFPFLSNACHDLLGLEPTQIYARPSRFEALIIDEDKTSWLDSLRISAQQGQSLNWEGRIRIDAWQDIKWINIRATPQACRGQSMQWTGLMSNITQSKKQEEEIRQSRKQLAELAAHVEEVREQERARIGRDLHDDLGGNLTAIKMMLAQLAKRLPSENPDCTQRISDLDALLDHSIESMHRLAADLRPGILDAGLVAALEWLTQELRHQTGIDFQLASKHTDIALDPKLATGLFRIAQEACNNICKHAKASTVTLLLHNTQSELLMEIIDNGCGMDPEAARSPDSFGLRSMHERSIAMGGTFSVASRQEKGSIISVCIPVLEQLEDCEPDC